MSAFFGNMMISLRNSISATTLTAVGNATTSSISVGVSGGRDVYTFLWVQSGTTCTINTPTSSSTTFTGSNTSGTTTVYCAVKDTITGNTLNTPNCVITWSSTAPSVPTVGSVSSGDKSFTLNWTAPTDDGGSPILGYFVQNSTNGGSTWSTAIDVGLVTTYTWSGNGNVYNGNTYIGRVLAYNSIGNGSYSSNSSGTIPTFAAPVILSINGTPGYPTPSAQSYRPFYINFTPTSCVDYANTRLYINYNSFDSFGSYYDSVNGVFSNLVTTTTGNQNTANIFTVYAQNIVQGGQFFISFPSQQFYIYAVTYNNDGYGVQSATAGYTTIPYTYGPPYLTSPYSSATGQFTVTGNTFQQISTYAIPDTITQITSLNIEGWVVITGINICSAGRNFTVFFSGNTTGTYSQSNSCNTAPFTTNSGTTHQFKLWNVIDTGYNCQGAGKIRVNGGGTIGTWSTSPDQRIRVIVNITGDSQQPY